MVAVEVILHDTNGIANEVGLARHGSGHDALRDLGEAFERLRTSLQATVLQARTISDGDLRRDAEVPGELGAALQRMTGNLRSMVGGTQAAAARVETPILA